MKKLRNGIKESEKEIEKLNAQKENLLTSFKEIEEKAFKVQDDYKKTEEVSFFTFYFYHLKNLPFELIFFFFLLFVAY